MTNAGEKGGAGTRRARITLGTILLALLLVMAGEPLMTPTDMPSTPPTAEQRLRSFITDAILSVAKDIRTRSGGVIRAVDAVQAWRIAPVFIAESHRMEPKAPLHFLVFFMANAAQESRFDEEATNPNYTDGRDPRMVDWGIGQFSGRNLVAAGIDPSLALNHRWSVPRMAGMVCANIKWARDNFPSSDPYYVAAMVYNKGKNGTKSILTRKPLKGESWMAFLKRAAAGHAHARGVMAFYRRFGAAIIGKGGE